MSIEAMKQALKALEKYCTPYADGTHPADETIASLRQALSEAQLSVNENSHAIEDAEKQDVELCSTESKETFDQPVAWAVVGEGDWGEWSIGDQFETNKNPNHEYWEGRGYKLLPLYITPPQREWVGLTDEERDDIWNRYCDEMGEASINDAPDITRAIEAKLRDKNGNAA